MKTMEGQTYNHMTIVDLLEIVNETNGLFLSIQIFLMFFFIDVMLYRKHRRETKTNSPQLMSSCFYHVSCSCSIFILNQF